MFFEVVRREIDQKRVRHSTNEAPLSQSSREKVIIESIEMISTDPSSPKRQQEYSVDDHILGEARFMKVICIGAGPAGINLAYQIQRHLQNTQLTIYEKNSSLGGTWFENKYPGCACDNPSHVYQFEWAPNPDWSMFYSPAPEILRYLEKVAKDHDLEQYIHLDQVVTKAQWFEDEGVWRVSVFDYQKGEEKEDWCHFLVNGSGVLNHWRWPAIPGLKSFEGSLLHSAQWDTEVEWADKRVAVIGNGSSGIQIVTALQPGIFDSVRIGKTLLTKFERLDI
jgi:cation diffusion facilitator CzcD-associated flavoprotein CzcO